ncbi:hypothetical protein EXS74_03885 [Candidatus Woesearchaeota archaeon]|nr:hypothetical protein [Candidatus Woesearchaeota archaeon]
MLTSAQIRNVERRRRVYGQDPYGPLCSDHPSRQSCYDDSLEIRAVSDSQAVLDLYEICMEIHGHLMIF